MQKLLLLVAIFIGANFSITAQNVIIQAKAYLQSAIPSDFETDEFGNPLMTDHLRVSPYTGKTYIPSQDPYSSGEGYTAALAGKFVHVGTGGSVDNTTIVDPESVFAVTGQNAIVDWVFMELRLMEASNTTVATRSGLLQRDGDVVDLDGVSPLVFEGVAPGNYYVVLRHRNHLGVMTMDRQAISSISTTIDFTDPGFALWDYGTKMENRDYTGLATNLLSTSAGDYRILWCGDFNADGKIKFSEPNSDLNMLFLDVVGFEGNTEYDPNYGSAHGYFQSDNDMNGMIKYDSPNDDRMSLMNALGNYDLNGNHDFNYDHFIAQLPE